MAATRSSRRRQCPLCALVLVVGLRGRGCAHWSRTRAISSAAGPTGLDAVRRGADGCAALGVTFRRLSRAA